MKFARTSVAVVLVAGCFTTSVSARDPFTLFFDNQTDSLRGIFGYASIDDALDALEGGGRLAAATGYGGTEQASAFLDFRGLPVQLAFPNAGATGGGTTLFFAVPGVNIDPNDQDGDQSTDSISFTGATRQESIELLKDFLKANKAATKAMFTRLAAESPVDPLAGNPDSLFSRRMRGDFMYGFTNKVSQIWGCSTSAFNFTNDAPIQVAIVGSASDVFRDAQARAAELQAQNEIGLGLGASSTTASDRLELDYKTLALEVPISYTAKFDSDPRRKFHVDFPLAYIDTDGAKTYSAGLGFAYTHPLSDVWSLSPAVGVGATESQDLGSAGAMYSYSLTSAYTWRLGGMALSMGNGLGRYNSLKVKVGDIEADADIKNTVFTNGFLLSGPSSLIAKNWTVEYSLVDTRITGDEVYSDGYDEIGIALGHIRTEMGVIDSSTKVGLSYLLADPGIRSLRLVLSSRF